MFLSSAHSEVGGSNSRRSVIFELIVEKGIGPGLLSSMSVFIPLTMGLSWTMGDHRNEAGSNRSWPDSYLIMTPAGGILEQGWMRDASVRLDNEVVVD